MRRLKVGLDLWGRLLRVDDREAVRALARRVKRLARLVGEVRDRDVVLDLLERTKPVGARPNDARAFHQFWGRLRDDSRTKRELLSAFLRTERDGGLLREIGATLDLRPRPSAGATLERLVAAEHLARDQRLARAHRRARARPSSARLHRLRIRLRQSRHLTELARPPGPTPAGHGPAAFRRLQDRLGVLHDLDVALATIDPELAGSPWTVELERSRKRARTAARAELSRFSRSLGRRRTPGRPARGGPA